MWPGLMAVAKHAPLPTQIVILPSPGVGHLVPFSELARRLALDYGFEVTLLLPPGATASLPAGEIKPFLATLPPGVTAISLAYSPDSDCGNDGDLQVGTEDSEAGIILSVVRCLPSIRTVLSSSAVAPPKALVVDMFGVGALDAAREAGVPGYVFFAMSAMPWLLAQHSLSLDPSTGLTAETSVRLPGCVPLHPEDVPEMLRQQARNVNSWFLSHLKRSNEADGILLNTFEAMEPGAVEYLLREREPGPGCPRAFPIGPLTHSVPSHAPLPCLEWLDAQPTSSVLFVSFGSGGTLSAEQLEELAAGLEGSGQRFLWVVRSPCSAGEGVNAAFFGDRYEDDPETYLPKGFLDRTRGRGMVLPSWAPQLAVLGHAATGGFLTHCGWNSILEAVERAVPMIAWPLFAEQSVNAALLVRGAQVAIRPEAPAAGQAIGREEIARVVKALMVGEEGKAVRAKVRRLQESAARAVGESGASTAMLSQLAEIWRSGSVQGHVA